MDKLFPPSRRRILAGIATIALSTCGLAAAQADDTAPLRVGVLTDMSSLYADITGPARLPLPGWPSRIFSPVPTRPGARSRS